MSGRTDGVVFQHAHHGCGSGTLEGIEEASHGHGDEARMHQASLGCKRIESATARLGGLGRMCLPFFAILIDVDQMA